MFIIFVILILSINIASIRYVICKEPSSPKTWFLVVGYIISFLTIWNTPLAFTLGLLLVFLPMLLGLLRILKKLIFKI